MKHEGISKDTKRAVIYARVSTKDQDASRQVRDLTAWAERLGYVLVAPPYVETKSGMRNDRKIRAEILAHAQRREIDTVLVTELSRWGRSTQDLITTITELASRRVSIEALQGLSFDLNTAQGKLFLTFMAAMSEFERDLIADRVKSGLDHARSKGVRLGRPAGYKTDDKHRAAVLDLKAHGFSYRDIAAKLKIGKDTIGRILQAADI